MNYISVCSGIEAATVAWHHLGWKPLGFSEIEKFPSEVLKHHYPQVPNLGDMTKFKEWEFNESVELLVGGTPCQSFSVAGLRKGLDDPRGNLMLTYLAIAARNKPKWLVWENVPGVLSSNGGLDFASLLRGMGECGYGFAYRVLDAQYFGVAQRRRRVFVVGCLGDWRSAAAVLFERDCLCGHPPPRREKRKGTSGYAESSFGGYREDNVGATLKASGGVLSGGSETFIAELPDICPTITTDMEKQVTNQLISQAESFFIPTRFYDHHPQDSRITEIEIAPTLNCRIGNLPIAEVTYCLAGAGSTSQNANGSNVNEEVSFTLNTTDVHGVASLGMSVDVISPTLDTSKTLAVMEVYPISTQNALGRENGRPDWSLGLFKEGDPSPTLTKSHSHAVALAPQMAVRRLTPVECERLQGFSDNYTNIKTNCPDGPRYKALGNSMAVPVMQWIGERIEMVENLKKELI